MKYIEVKRYEDLKGTDKKNPLKEYVGTYWTPVNDQNYGTQYQQWQIIRPFFGRGTMKIHDSVPGKNGTSGET